MAWGRVIRMLKCNTVYLARYRSMKIPVSFRTAYARADKQILVDSGATDNFIHPRFIRRLALGTQKLERPRKTAPGKSGISTEQTTRLAESRNMWT